MNIGAWIEAHPDGALILVFDEEGRVLLPDLRRGRGVETLPARESSPLLPPGSAISSGSDRSSPLRPVGPASSSPVLAEGACPQRVEQEPSASVPELTGEGVPPQRHRGRLQISEQGDQ